MSHLEVFVIFFSVRKARLCFALWQSSLTLNPSLTQISLLSELDVITTTLRFGQDKRLILLLLLNLLA